MGRNAAENATAPTSRQMMHTYQQHIAGHQSLSHPVKWNAFDALHVMVDGQVAASNPFTSGALEKSKYRGPGVPSLKIPGARTSSFGGSDTCAGARMNEVTIALRHLPTATNTAPPSKRPQPPWLKFACHGLLGPCSGPTPEFLRGARSERVMQHVFRGWLGLRQWH